MKTEVIIQRHAMSDRYLKNLRGVEIGGSAHNAFGLNTRNVDTTDDMNGFFKLAEIRYCGQAMPVDIVADGAHLPLPDKSEDFVISSHMIEHIFDPIGAMKEWARVASCYIVAIVPQRDALPSDRDLPLTPLAELEARHRGEVAVPPDSGHHYTRWTSEGFKEMCESIGLRVVEVEDPDLKCGNGFAIVVRLCQDDCPKDHPR